MVAGINLNEVIPNLLSKWKKQLLSGYQANIPIPLEYSESIVYIGDIYVGSPKQKLQVIYDTGFDYLVVEDSTCKSCLGQKFISSNSTTYAVHDESYLKINYNFTKLTGFLGKDTVSFDPTNNVVIANDAIFY